MVRPQVIAKLAAPPKLVQRGAIAQGHDDKDMPEIDEVAARADRCQAAASGSKGEQCKVQNRAGVAEERHRVVDRRRRQGREGAQLHRSVQAASMVVAK